MDRCTVVLVGALSLTSLTGCNPGGAASPAPPASAAAAEPSPLPASTTAASMSTPSPSDYEIRGTVTAISADRQSVTLDHEAIPGLMAAMKMEYRVKDSALVRGLKTGDQVAGRLQAQGTDYVITELKRR